MLEDYLPMDGDAFGMADGHVYLKSEGTFDPYVWGGKCMRIDEQTIALRKLAITLRQAVGGGVERHQVRYEPPGESSFSLIMKRVQASRIKTLLMSCLWSIDHRVHCNGMERDNPNGWKEITRFVVSAADERRMSGSGWEDATGDMMVTFPMTALDGVDLYRVNGEGAAITAAAMVMDISVCHGDQCPSGCNNQQDCKVAAVTSMVALGSPWLLTNLAGGSLDQWTETELTEWTTGGADAVLCLGDLLVMVNATEFEVMRSDNFGVTRAQIVQTADTTPVVWGAGNAPTQVDGIDQYYILMCGLGGYMYRSTTAGKTWKTVDAGFATTEALARVMIARDRPQVAYAIGANNAFIKTENSGRTWLDVGGPSAGDALLGLLVVRASRVLVLNDDGELWETSDGAESWTMQLDPDGMPATLTYADISGCAGDDMYMVATDGTELLIYRNASGGTSGEWLNRGTEHWEDLADDPTSIACCGPNHAIAGGGMATAGWVYLLN